MLSGFIRTLAASFVILTVCVLQEGCRSSGSSAYLPKPKGYNRIDLPPHAYRTLPAEHPYTFQYSQYARILQDSFAPGEPHWIFIDYPGHQANIQLTYKRVQHNPGLLAEYIDDSYKLAGKHQNKASAIQEQLLTTPAGKTVTIFRLLGDVPSPYQFYTTDSTTHFLRGALYFPASDKGDSLAPVIDYLREDMMEILNTLSWRE